MQIVTAKMDMANDVYRFVRKNHGYQFDESVFLRLFHHRWDTRDDHGSVLLDDDGEVRGFWGAIYSHHPHAGREVRSCNPTTWVVDPKFRMHALAMFKPFKQQDQYSLNGASPSDPNILNIHIRLGFQVIDDREIHLDPRAALGAGFGRARVVTSGDPAFSSLLSDEDRFLYESHKQYPGYHCALVSENAYSYVVYKVRRRRKVVRRLQLLHISQPSHFCDHIGAFLRHAVLRQGGVGIYTDSRFLPRHDFKGARLRPMPIPKIYRPLAGEQIDPPSITNLFSETILFDL